MKSLLVALFSLTLGFGATTVRAAEATGADAVLRLDQTRLTAMMAGDGAALGRLFSETVLFVHSDGRIEGKADYIKNMTAGDTAYTDARTTEVQAKPVTPDVVVLTGAQEMRKKLGPTWSEVKLRFMSVWRKEDGVWRMIAWQSMRPAGNSVVPSKS